MYRYSAVTSQGKTVKGHFDAPSPQLLKKMLRSQGLILTSYTKKGNRRFKQQIPKKERLPFVLSLSQLLSAGLPLYDSLELLKNQQQSEAMKEMLTVCLDKLKEGSSFSAALAGYATFFDQRFVAMIASGEQSGNLSEAVHALLAALESEQAKKKKLFALLFYPAVLLSFSVVVIALVLLVVVPSLQELFGTGEGFTGLIFSLSALLRAHLPLITALFSGGLLAFLFNRHRLKKGLEALAFQIAPLRRLLVESSLSRLCGTLSMLLRSGVPLLEALTICEGHAITLWQKTLLQRSITKIQEGVSLSDSLQKEKELPPLFAKMIAASEDTGTMVEATHKLALFFEESFQRKMEGVMALAEPLILIVMGAFIAAIMLAVLLPLSDPELLLKG